MTVILIHRLGTYEVDESYKHVTDRLSMGWKFVEVTLPDGDKRTINAGHIIEVSGR